MRSNYIEFPFRIIEKRRRRGKKRNCSCSLCRKKSILGVTERPLRKIRLAK